MLQFKGIHFIYDFSNIIVKDTKKYNEIINEILDEVIKKTNLNQIDRSNNLFDDKNTLTPPGFATVCVLDESHISAHSYSELGILAVDIFTCGNLENGKKAGKLLKELILKNFKNVKIEKEGIVNRFPFVYNKD